jgi:uncharacterized membrane protein
VAGTGMNAFFWSFLHEPKDFVLGHFKVFVLYPVLPWIGILSLGYYLGGLYAPSYDTDKRRTILLSLGLGAMVLFVLLRSGNFYGDAAYWSSQKTTAFSLLSFLNVTKYPPSLLYTLMTLGPALFFLGLAEKPLNILTAKIAVYGRVPFFYYVVHLYLIHLFALIAAVASGYNASDMILTDKINRVPELKGYGFNLSTVYFVWIGLVLLLYPCCKWFDRYKKTHQAKQWWLSYL